MTTKALLQVRLGDEDIDERTFSQYCILMVLVTWNSGHLDVAGLDFRCHHMGETTCLEADRVDISSHVLLASNISKSKWGINVLSTNNKKVGLVIKEWQHD